MTTASQLVRTLLFKIRMELNNIRNLFQSFESILRIFGIFVDWLHINFAIFGARKSK